MEILQASTEVGYHTLLQGIFPTQGSNQHLLHYTQILYPASHLGSSCFPKTVMNGGWGEKVVFFSNSKVGLANNVVKFLSLGLE